MGKPVLKMFVGALAGLIVWMIFEPQMPADYYSSRLPQVMAEMVIWLGVAIGLAIGGFSGYQQGSKLHLFRGLVLGGLFGLIGMNLGAGVGYGIVKMLGMSSALQNPSVPLLLRMPARFLDIAPMGLFLGAAIGASTLNWRRAVQGAIGGTIGAGIGALLFDPISSALAPLTMSMKHVAQGGVAEVGIFGRAALCVLLGAGIGLFIGIIENVAKVAWLRLAVGRNEGKEWVVDAAQTIIGRSETAQVPLFGDMAIAPKHASILRQGPQYILVNESSGSGTFLNGQLITQSPLFHGAVIGIGSYKLEFLMKTGTAPQRAAEALRGQQHYALQTAGGPGGAPAAAMYQPPAPQVPIMPQPNVPSAPSVPTQMVSPQPMSGMDTLVAIAGPLSGQRFPVSGNLEVGREGLGIPLTFDTSASRKHASFSPSPAGTILTDLGSTNGTFVNDQRVQAASLVKGDLVRIGITTFRVE
ncbi:MAG TPA: FHA domain-containing protein [Fimbriimonadaceae bacterium]|jgi:pSer/pThr/pTyr-binding forkhead associated (FHA) protein